MAYALRDRAKSTTSHLVPGKYCHLVKGKEHCNSNRTEADGTIKRLCAGTETIYSTDGNCTTWDANEGMYDSCLKGVPGARPWPTGANGKTFDLVLNELAYYSGSSAAYTGRTQYMCLP